MARAFFVSRWADENPEEASGVELLDVAPEADEEAEQDALNLIREMEAQYGASLEELFERAKNAPHRYADRPCDEEHFGHYAAMQAMGEGVGLESVCDADKVFPDFPLTVF